MARQEPKLRLMFVLTELLPGKEDSRGCVNGTPLMIAGAQEAPFSGVKVKEFKVICPAAAVPVLVKVMIQLRTGRVPDLPVNTALMKGVASALVVVRLKVSCVASPPTVAMTYQVPAVPLAMSGGAVAKPLESANTVTVDWPAKLPPCFPELGLTVKVTMAFFAPPLELEALFTCTVSGVWK